MAIDYKAIAKAGGIGKGKTRKSLKARKTRVKRDRIAEVRAYVFARDKHTCRCCSRPAESMHEIRPRSLGGAISTRNSVALCGSGTTGCHGFCQTHQIEIGVTSDGADGPLSFMPTSHAAAEWMGREVDTPKLSKVP